MPEKSPQTNSNYSEYEKPGRVAAYCNINYNEVMKSIEQNQVLKLDVYSSSDELNRLPPMGQIDI
jgi:hypothetical protein